MKGNNKITVVVGMSGGVDSSVAALLLKKQGYNVIGLHMKGANPETNSNDEKRVRELGVQIGIEIHVADYSDQMQLVKDYFVSEYQAGRTPNPCIVCNREVKFKPFIDYCEKIGADYFATGHYARILHENGMHVLMKAFDENKDQSYFLCQLSNKQLEKALFPLGELSKDEVRQIAKDNNLISSETKDSYDVCFLGAEKFKDFMGKNYPEKPGNIIDTKTGKIIGIHSGISKYTIGQRRGLGIGGGFGKIGESWFVSKKDANKNIIYVTQGNGAELMSSSLKSNKVNWIVYPKRKEFDCTAKFRYRQKEQNVHVSLSEHDEVCVKFQEKQRAITLGQYVVFYDGEICLGGGVIDEVNNG